jgi:hypothetical protein
MKMTIPFNPLNYPLTFEEPKRFTRHSAWQEHIPFAFLLVDLVKPSVIVELGTHYGDSYCAFCQAVEALKLPTRCWAVDTWEGDTQAGAYGEDVLADLRAHHDSHGYDRFSTFLQVTFDQALTSFEDRSVDLLHIDGLHTYEAVKHDYETWLPKMSERGVILFHDTCEEQPGFGVKQLWREVSASRPHYEFQYGSGLGVLAVGENVPQELLDILVLEGADREVIHTFFHRLGSRLGQQTRFAEIRRYMENEITAMCRTWNWRAVQHAKRAFGLFALSKHARMPLDKS